MLLYEPQRSLGNNLNAQRGDLTKTLLQIPEVETYIVAIEAIEPVDRSYPERSR